MVSAVEDSDAEAEEGLDDDVEDSRATPTSEDGTPPHSAAHEAAEVELRVVNLTRCVNSRALCCGQAGRVRWLQRSGALTKFSTLCCAGLGYSCWSGCCARGRSGT